MNKLPAIITKIQQSGAIILVDLDVNGQAFSAMLIESTEPPEWLFAGHAVDLVFKETEVSLAKNLAGLISTRNRIKCEVKIVERGDLLSKITLSFQEYELTSAVTTRAVDSLQIKAGEEVEALVKANEVSLMKSEFN